MQSLQRTIHAFHITKLKWYKLVYMRGVQKVHENGIKVWGVFFSAKKWNLYITVSENAFSWTLWRFLIYILAFLCCQKTQSQTLACLSVQSSYLKVRVSAFCSRWTYLRPLTMCLVFYSVTHFTVFQNRVDSDLLHTRMKWNEKGTLLIGNKT